MTAPSIKLVVGLGNPGSKYENTRHNLGQMLVARHLPISSDLNWQKKFKGFYAAKSVNGEQIHFLLPLTYMNLSGESVLAAAQFYDIPVESILVVHDELDLPFGQIAFKKGGGLAGHNGLRSINSCLGTQDFLRLRLGISRPSNIEYEISNWVLSRFSSAEQADLEIYLQKAGEALMTSLQSGLSKASSTYNKKDLLAN